MKVLPFNRYAPKIAKCQDYLGVTYYQVQIINCRTQDVRMAKGFTDEIEAKKWAREETQHLNNLRGVDSWY